MTKHVRVRIRVNYKRHTSLKLKIFKMFKLKKVLFVYEMNEVHFSKEGLIRRIVKSEFRNDCRSMILSGKCETK